MLTTEDISDIVGRLNKWGIGSKKEPYFSTAHKFISQLRERVSYHADYDIFPEKLIASAAPNESDAEFKYRKANYKQKTKPVWDKALSATYRIFNEQNYKIDWKEQDYKDYFTYLYPVYGDYVQFYKDVVHKMKFADPNAVLAVKPQYIPGEVKDNEFIPDQSKQVEPIAELFIADCVFEYIEGEYCLLKTQRKSEITVAGKTKNEGLIFELYDRNNIYILTQTGDQKDWSFTVSLYYEHNWQSLPAWKLKGHLQYDAKETLYYSYFMGAIADLDEALFLNSTLFGATNRVAFPTRWFYEDTCSSCSGHGYTIDYTSGSDAKIPCQLCGATGKKMTWTWGKDIVIPMPDNLTDPDTAQLPTPPAGVIDPSVASLTFLNDKVKALLDSAFIPLNIETASKPNGQTATEVAIDRDEFFSFLIQISKEEFYLLTQSIDAQAFMRYGEGYEQNRIAISAPTEFELRNSEERIIEIQTAKTAGMPQAYIDKLVIEDVSQRFDADTEIQRVIELGIYCDGLQGLSDGIITNMVNRGLIDRWKETLHYYKFNYLYSFVSADENYLQKTNDEIKTDLEAKAKADTLVPSQRKADDILQTL